MKWSKEREFTIEEVKEVPKEPGVYKFLQETKYRRYKGETRIIKYGCSENISNELHQHFSNHTNANMISKIRKTEKVTFQFTTCLDDTPENTEKKLLREFEDEHFDLPVCNFTRGYKRGEDVHYRK